MPYQKQQHSHLVLLSCCMLWYPFESIQFSNAIMVVHSWWPALVEADIQTKLLCTCTCASDFRGWRHCLTVHPLNHFGIWMFLHNSCSGGSALTAMFCSGFPLHVLGCGVPDHTFPNQVGRFHCVDRLPGDVWAFCTGRWLCLIFWSRMCCNSGVTRTLWHIYSPAGQILIQELCARVRKRLWNFP